jgi:toxin YoeB
MNILSTPHAWEDYAHWQSTDRKMLARINELIRDISRDPDGVIGKPERLKNDLSGWLSRRINHEHRLVYRIEEDNIVILQCRYHY